MNSAVLLGCWVFAALTLLLLRNQQHTLSVLEEEIARQKRQLEREYAPVADTLKNTFKSLESRAFTQQIVLWVIDGVVVAGLVLSHWVYARLTPDAWAHIWS